MDNIIKEILHREEQRQQDTIELIASENFASDAVRELSGSVFTNKYAEGYPDARYYNGCEHMDEIEVYAQEQLKELFGYNHVNVQPHSGANANLAVMNAVLKPGDTIVSMDLSAGGHLSHGASVNISGKLYEVAHYGINYANDTIDTELMRRAVLHHRPKLLIVGASAYPRQIPWHLFRNAADELDSDCLVLADIAHYSGLIAGGSYQGPEHHADIVTSTTHKTLRGPRGGVIMWNDNELTKKINSSVFPGTQGGPLMHQIAAKAQAFTEALEPEFKVYARAVVDNAIAMTDVFKQRGVKLQTDGTDSHIILLNFSQDVNSGQVIANALEEHGITVNKNSVPNDPKGFRETSGIRIGTAAETTRGKTQKEFEDIAHKICDIVENLI